MIALWTRWKKHAREMLGLSQREIALRLKLRVNTISDIEHDRLTQPTAAPFARGYIADYARLVNIDPKTVVELYNHNVLEVSEIAKNQNKVAAKKRTAVPKNDSQAKERAESSHLQDIPASNKAGKSNKGMLVKLGAVLLVLLLIIVLVWMLMSDDTEQSGTSGTVSVNEPIVSTQSDNLSSGELIINDVSSETSSSSGGYQDLLNAPQEDPFAKNSGTAAQSSTEELLINSAPAADKTTAANTSENAAPSTDKELAVVPSPAKDEAVKTAKEQALQEQQAAEAAQTPKLSSNLRDISSAAKLSGREGLASLNNVSVIIKAPVSLQISDSRGKVLVSGSYKAGDRVSATGIPPLKVAVTDTSSVTVNYMGGTIAVPATKQATFTLPNR